MEIFKDNVTTSSMCILAKKYLHCTPNNDSSSLVFLNLLTSKIIRSELKWSWPRIPTIFQVNTYICNTGF